MIDLINVYQNQGFRAFAHGGTINDNPYGFEVPYKEWCAGWRKAKDSTKDDRIWIRWSRCMHDVINEKGEFKTEEEYALERAKA